MLMSNKDMRTRILEAAAHTARSYETSNLTIEAVAKQAGISKGGLLHHFPSKKALIAGMVEDLIKHYQSNIEKNANQDTIQDGRGKWTRSYIEETFVQTTPDKDIDLGIIAAAATNKDALSHIRDAYEQWQDQIDNDGLDPINATILRLAADGLWFSEIFGLAPLEEERRQKVLKRLVQLTTDNE